MPSRVNASTLNDQVEIKKTRTPKPTTTGKGGSRNDDEKNNDEALVETTQAPNAPLVIKKRKTTKAPSIPPSTQPSSTPSLSPSEAESFLPSNMPSRVNASTLNDQVETKKTRTPKSTTGKGGSRNDDENNNKALVETIQAPKAPPVINSRKKTGSSFSSTTEPSLSPSFAPSLVPVSTPSLATAPVLTVKIPEVIRSATAGDTDEEELGGLCFVCGSEDKKVADSFTVIEIPNNPIFHADQMTCLEVELAGLLGMIPNFACPYFRNNPIFKQGCRCEDTGDSLGTSGQGFFAGTASPGVDSDKIKKSGKGKRKLRYVTR
jgi:hypothetical protein